MSKNLIPEIAKMLGVELGEEFEININDEIYQITKEGMWRKKMNDEGHFDMWEEVPRCFIKLLAGGAEVIKLPWKPKLNEQYYSFGGRFLRDPTVWIVVDVIWQGLAYDVAMFDKGWVYRTKEEAEAALPKVAAEMGVEYEL